MSFDPTSLLDGGVLAVVVAWFMLRIEKLLNRAHKELTKVNELLRLIVKK